MMETSEDYTTNIYIWMSSNSTTASIELPNNSVTSMSDSTITNGVGSIRMIFTILVSVIGFVGMFANGFVASALWQSTDSKKDKVNVLVLNQLMLDMWSCAMLTAVYATRAAIANVYLTSTWGSLLCKLFTDELPVWIGLNGSMLNLVFITVERYVMIVHPIWHKNHVRRWMINTGVALAWFEGAALNVPLFIVNSHVQNGRCMELDMTLEPLANYFYTIWYFSFSYVIPLVFFVYCYGRILMVVGRKAQASKSTTASTSTTGTAGTTAADANTNRIKMNVIKTMIMVTAFFLICWLPNSVYVLLFTVNPDMYSFAFYAPTMLLAFLNVCVNPFIYAGQYELVRRRLNEMCFHVGYCANASAARLLNRAAAVHPSSMAPTSRSHHTGVSTAVGHITTAIVNVAPVMISVDSSLIPIATSSHTEGTTEVRHSKPDNANMPPVDTLL